MKTLLYGLIIILSLMAPVQRLDVAKLQPVEAVAVYVKNGNVILATDTEDKGRGADADEALADLKERTPAVIYLDTARYLLIGPGAESCVDELLPHLRRSVKVRPYLGGDIKETVKYLDVHDRPGASDN